MRSATLKWIILISTISIGLLVATQLYWLNKVYNFEQKEFNSSVIKSIQGVYEDMELTGDLNTHLQKLIEQPDANSYLFKINSIPPKDSLLNDVLYNLEDFDVFADCELAVHDAKSSGYIYRSYLPAAGTRHKAVKPGTLKYYDRNYTYVLLNFPYRNRYILGAMTWWIASGSILLVVIIALGFSLFYLYRQKSLNEVQNDFIRNVTHEFQTPLTTLTVGLEAITKSSVVDHPDKLKKYTRLMQGQTNYLNQHIANLMKVLKAEANGIPIQKEPVSPNALIREAAEQLYLAAEEKHAKISLALEEQDTMLIADRGSLYLAILNILSNAIKYAQDPVIVIETMLVNDKYRIAIKDNGMGIEEQFKKKLFKKFFRVPSGDVHNAKGLGLGLYFTKKVITEHHGRILVNSIKGIGSEFIIEIPLIKK